MRTWLDLEERFRALLPAPQIRLDMQWGAAGEHWRVAGTGATGPWLREFEVLCGLSGRLLERSLDRESELGKALLAEKDPLTRWYRLLKHKGHGVRNELYAYQTDNAGNHMGNIYSATIEGLVQVCANQCLELEVHSPVHDDREWYTKIYDTHGREIVIGAIVAIVTAIAGVLFG
jgi:hypothetical protein